MTQHSVFSVTIVIVTYNREQLLSRLLRSIDSLSPAPARVIVVNNASTDQTLHRLGEWQKIPSAFAKQIVTLSENTGGAGGFRLGVQHALYSEADWFWLMDDDVELLPDALENAEKWCLTFDAFMGQRRNFDGKLMYWPHHLSSSTGVAPLVNRSAFKTSNSVQATSGCFEGMFVSRRAVDRIGLPDSRFFIAWDDATYGWMLSQRFRVGYVSDVFLKRTRELRRIGSSSLTVEARNDLGRFYAIRNRAIVAKYFRLYGSYKPFRFALGTTLTILKESIRTLLVEGHPKGIIPIVRGSRAMWSIQRDAAFTVPEDGGYSGISTQ